ncbi:MFS transporter [Uliginosibacterium sp. H3]|uniref:MFS transporter n=1 Tax=Uliginosibacterium silvisoli TaxID=3114758 RepID=A0ABU6K909_9RHOO|nr:MFS transporter [Uliginosibacterium sp. H3]
MSASEFALFRHRPFLSFWFGRVFTSMSNNMLAVAVGWQMYDLTHSAMDLGLVGLVQFAPALLFTLIVGHVADRYDRRRIITVCLALQTLVIGVLIASTHYHWISRDLILICSLLIGTAKAFQMPTQQALAPLVVPLEVLPRAMALSSSGVQFAIIVGPAFGGFLYAAGANAVYSLCCALTFCSAISFLSIRIDHAPAPREPVTLRSMFAGLDFIWHRKAVLGAISLDLFAVLLGGATALLPIFARDILLVGPIGLGMLRSAPAVGALTTSIWLARKPIERRVGKVMFGAVALYGVATLVFAFSKLFLLSLGALVITGAADMVSVVIRQSLVQLETPNEMRGRVSAVNSIFIGASNQLGEFESGTTAALWGAVTSVAIGGIGTLLVVATWMKHFPQLTNRERLTSDETDKNS